MKRFLLILFIGILITKSSNASHIVGGEITWKCLSTGEYVFYTTLYRDCGPNTASFPTNPITLSVLNTPRPNNNSLHTITLNYVTPTPGTPIGPNGGAGVGTVCQSCAGQGGPITCEPPNGDYGTLERYQFRSNPITLSGKPPSGNANQWLNGWVFVFTPPCCRSNSIQNLVNKSGAILKAIMYGDGRASQNPCYDSSPEFFSDPATLICEGYDFQFSNTTQDIENDSLSFSFENVMDGSGFGVNFSPQFNTWAAGFALNTPTPTPAMNPKNKTATINPVTGEIRMTAYLPATVPVNRAGIYVISSRVDAYALDANNNRVKTASIFRDMPFNIFRCPNINFTYVDSIGNPINVNVKNNPPYFKINKNLGFNSLDTTIQAGDSISINIAALDSNLSPCSPTNLTTVSLEAYSSQFDTSYSNPLGNCLLKPCATLNPAPTGGLVKRLEGIAQISTKFNWKTSCNHLDTAMGGQQAVNYSFIFKVQDDFCPIPAYNYIQLNIKVLPNKTSNPAEVYCIDTLNGKFNIHFDHKDNVDNSFQYINVFLGQRPNGSNQAFTTSNTPFCTINYSGGSFKVPNLTTNPSIEYAFKLETVYKQCFDTAISYSAQTPFYSINNLNAAVIAIYQNGRFIKVNQSNADSYQWYRNGIILPNDTFNFLYVNDSATYYAVLKYGSCAVQTEMYQLMTTSIGNYHLNNEGIVIFPNPSDGLLTVALKDKNEKIQTISVYSLEGKQIKKYNASTIINLQELKNSLYFMRVETDKNVYIKKIIKN